MGIGNANLRKTQIYSWIDEQCLALRKLPLANVVFTGTSGSVDTLTANGDTLLTAAIANTGVLADTVLLVAEHINAQRSLSWWAFADAGTLYVVPKNRSVTAVTIVSTTTTMGRTDNNGSGGATTGTRVSQAQASAVADVSLYEVSFDFTKHARSLNLDGFNEVGRLDLQLDQAWYWFMNFAPKLGKAVSAATDKELSVGGIDDSRLFIFNKSGSAAAPSYTVFGG